MPSGSSALQSGTLKETMANGQLESEVRIQEAEGEIFLVQSMSRGIQEPQPPNPKDGSIFPTSSKKRRLDKGEDAGHQPGPSFLPARKHDEDEKMPENDLLETAIVPMVSRRVTRSQKPTEYEDSESTTPTPTPHQVAKNLGEKYKNNRKIKHVKKGETCLICIQHRGFRAECEKKHSDVEKKLEADLQRLLPDKEEVEITLVEKVLRYLKSRYRNEVGILKEVHIRCMIVEGHKLNFYDSQEKVRKFEEETARFEKTIRHDSLLNALNKFMEKIEGDTSPLRECIERNVAFCMYCNTEKREKCKDAHRLTLGQYAANEVERSLSGSWRSVEHVIEKLRDQQRIYKKNLDKSRNRRNASRKRKSDKRPKQYQESQPPSAPTPSHQMQSCRDHRVDNVPAQEFELDADEYNFETGFKEPSTSSRTAGTSRFNDPHHDHREDDVVDQGYEYDEDEYDFEIGYKEPSTSSRTAETSRSNDPHQDHREDNVADQGDKEAEDIPREVDEQISEANQLENKGGDEAPAEASNHFIWNAREFEKGSLAEPEECVITANTLETREQPEGNKSDSNDVHRVHHQDEVNEVVEDSPEVVKSNDRQRYIDSEVAGINESPRDASGSEKGANEYGICRLVVEDIIDNEQDTMALSTTITSNPQPELPNHPQQPSPPQHLQPSCHTAQEWNYEDVLNEVLKDKPLLAKAIKVYREQRGQSTSTSSPDQQITGSSATGTRSSDQPTPASVSEVKREMNRRQGSVPTSVAAAQNAGPSTARGSSIASILSVVEHFGPDDYDSGLGSPRGARGTEEVADISRYRRFLLTTSWTASKSGTTSESDPMENEFSDEQSNSFMN
ncbi:Protein CBG14219 [Caenorhabditis briggsae]|uniref:Uncharacterized protein n=2 Tax=Caenorhabditis briggsae TaxID=6238 RepID=A0AAE8ZS68_CAEBR|nr:Protein CBG14219 [Caenorhabditis briggsae]ULT81792.1 hypothetical protein L3Y34_011635 [Caenorhabditis briggsae]CAP32819.4 Protein CBG14219 [Caenorhabditis briggsae]